METKAIDKVTALKEISGETLSLKEQVQAKQICSQEDLFAANDLLKKIKQRIKAVDEKRKYYKEPFLEGALRVDNDFKPYLDSLEEIRRILERQKIIPYQEEQERLQREEERRRRDIEAQELDAKQKVLDEIAKKTKSEFAKQESAKVAEQQEFLKTAPIEINTTVRSQKATGSLKKAWKFEIMKESEVPLEYKSVDERKVKDALKYGIREIKGLRIWEETTGVTTR